MKNPNKSSRHIPARYIHYTFVCRNCGKSDDGTFDKFTNPKQRDDIFCAGCEEYIRSLRYIEGCDSDTDDNLPF